MKAQEMVMRSEIRQILNEAGINRETVKQMVKDTIEDVIKAQVNQVLMERKGNDLSAVVGQYVDRQTFDIVRTAATDAIKNRLRFLDFSVSVHVTDRSKEET